MDINVSTKLMREQSNIDFENNHKVTSFHTFLMQPNVF